MGDELRPWSAGDPLNGMPKELLNDLIEVIKDFKRKRTIVRAPQVAKPVIHGKLHFENHTGAMRNQYSVVGFGDQVRAPLPANSYFFGDYVFKTLAPSSTLPFAILQEPMRNTTTALAPAVDDGETWALVSTLDTSFQWANAINDDYAKLAGQAVPGPARILSINSGATWSSATTYAVGDVVHLTGSTLLYTCNTAHTNHTPPNASYWTPGATVWALVVLEQGGGPNCNAFIRIPYGSVPDANGWILAYRDEWNEASQQWVQVETVYVRDANS